MMPVLNAGAVTAAATLICVNGQGRTSLGRSYRCRYVPHRFTVLQTGECVAWLDGLKARRAQIRIAARLRPAQVGSLGDWQPVEGEFCEMRVHHGPGYRRYFVRWGRVVVVLLHASDKSPQKRDIRHALKLATTAFVDLIRGFSAATQPREINGAKGLVFRSCAVFPGREIDTPRTKPSFSTGSKEYSPTATYTPKMPFKKLLPSD